MSNDNFEGLSGSELDAQLRKRVEARIKERNAFYIHLITFVGVNLLLWVIWLTTDAGGFPWPLYAGLPWLMGLVIHGLVVYQNSGRAVERRQQTIEREIEREKLRLGLVNDAYEKPKRERIMRLSDDGELVQDGDTAAANKSKRG